MTLYRFPENRITKMAWGVFLFLLLYLARDTLVTSTVLGFYKSQFLTLGLVALAGIAFLWYHRKDWRQILLDRRMGLMAVSMAVFLLPMVIKRDWQLMYFSVLLCIGIGVFLSYCLTLEELAGYYVRILTVLCSFSIVAAYLLRILPDRGILTVPMAYNSHDVDFYNFILSFVSVDYVATRNFGIFREPGVYQFFLILGLYLNHYWVKWEKEWHMWAVSGVLALGMVTTFATGGLAELALLAVVVFFDRKLYRKKWVLVLVLILAALMGIFLCYLARVKNELYWTIYGMVIGKFVDPKEASLGDRVGSVLVNMQAYLRSPLVGGRLREVLFGIENNTSSTTILFAMAGTCGGLLHVAGWLALIWKRGQKLWVTGMLAVILFMSFNTQNLIADLFLWLFPVAALCRRLSGGQSTHSVTL